MRAISIPAAALVLAGHAFADDIWHVRPGEDYAPDTYCRWNRSGLPLPQQKICEAWDRRSPSQKPNLRMLEADNGVRFAIDLNSIVHDTNGNAEVVAYLDEGGAAQMTFDCHGHYIDAGLAIRYVPPRSVAGAIQSIVCKRK